MNILLRFSLQKQSSRPSEVLSGSVTRISVSDEELHAPGMLSAGHVLWTMQGLSGDDRPKILVSEPGDGLLIQRATVSGLPFYYAIDSNGSFWASNRVLVLKEAGLTLIVNHAVLPEYFNYRCVAAPETFYEGIKQVPFGCVLSVRFISGSCRVSVRDRFRPPLPSARHTLVTAADEINRLIEDSVTSELPRGSLLYSGGLDSSIVLQAARKHQVSTRTYSTSYPFDNPVEDRERQYAEAGAQELGVEHRHMTLPSPYAYLEHVIKAIALAEQPIHHLQSALLNYMFENLHSEAESVVWTGLGAGGCFGNFRNHLYWKDKPVTRLLQALNAGCWVDRIVRASGRGGDLQRALSSRSCPLSLLSAAHPIWKWHAYGDRKWIHQVFHVEDEQLIQNPVQTLSHYVDRPENDVWALYSLLVDEAATYSIWSQIAAGSGVSLYSPFYNQNVLRTAFSIDWNTKLQSPKNALRKKMASRLQVPRSILARTKAGFGPSAVIWAQENGPLAPLMDIARKGIDFDDMPIVGTDMTAGFMRWNLINYGIWNRLFLQGENTEKLIDELAFVLGGKVDA